MKNSNNTECIFIKDEICNLNTCIYLNVFIFTFNMYVCVDAYVSVAA